MKQYLNLKIKFVHEFVLESKGIVRNNKPNKILELKDTLYEKFPKNQEIISQSETPKAIDEVWTSRANWNV